MNGMNFELGIDSASDQAAIAVLKGDTVLAERRWTVKTNYSQELLGGIDATLREAKTHREELAAIAVDIGPGGYSGLRSGVATAQGISVALGIPLAGVSCLETAAFPHLNDGEPIVAVHEAGGGRLAWAAYGGNQLEPITLQAPRLDEMQECLQMAPSEARWCGELSAELLAMIDGAQVPVETNVRHAADLVRLAHLHQAYGDPALVDVIYLRPPSITQPKNQTSTHA